MSEEEIEVFKEWCLEDTIGVGVGLKEYIEIETDIEKQKIAVEVLKSLLSEK